METYYPDFFNDVFGPVMQPGSSSHTAGPCRIGFEARCLLGEEPREIIIRLNRDGSFAGTFGLMNEDLGMLSGAMGNLPDNDAQFEIHSILKKKGIAFHFETVELSGSRHPNAVEFVLRGESGKTIRLTGISVGGGMIDIVDICGYSLHYNGDSYLTGVCVPAASCPDGALPDFLLKKNVVESGSFRTEAKGTLFYARTETFSAELSSDASDYAQEVPGAVPFTLRPVLPVTAISGRKKQLFDGMTGWIRLVHEKGITLPEGAVLYEQEASGLSRAEILEKIESLRLLMEQQTENVYRTEEGLLENPFSGYGFRQWQAYTEKKDPLSGTLGARLIRYVYGVQALQKGTCLVPGPMGTGGGFLYAAFRAVAEERGLSPEDLREGLLVAAGVGAVSYTRGNPTGEEMGCTGECGVCGAMASAGICHMCGGTPEQVENAASLTLQMAAGWPCDPIPGGSNQPCLSRFMTAMTMAVTFADLALSGRDAVLPFDEVFDACNALSKEMSADLKCTSRGGMCATRTAGERKKEFREWFRSQNSGILPL